MQPAVIDRRKYIETGAICFIALLFIFRPACPFFRYPFVLFYFLFAGYFVFSHYKLLIKDISGFIRSFALPLSLVLILFVAFILSGKLYLLVFKDVINALILMSLFFMLYHVITDRRILDVFSSRLAAMFIYFSVFISAVALLELFDILSNHEFLSNYYIYSDLLRSRLLFDYNYAILPLFFGMLGVLNQLKKQNSLLRTIIFNIFFFAFSLSILFSGSVRGIIVLSIFYAILVLLKVFTVVKNSFSAKKIVYKFNSVFWSFVFLTISVYILILHTSGSFKTNALELIGSNNVSKVKHDITAYLHKYVYLADKNITFQKFNSFLWTPDFDPKDPDSGWGTRIHSDVYPLTGLNSEIVPKGSIGYKIDNTSDSDTSDRVNCRIWTAIPFMYNENDHELSGLYSASVYCYLSNDFNGSYARIYNADSLCYYDLNNIGTWQLLKIEFYCESKPDAAFEWAMLDSLSIKNLKGYVVFAHPACEKIFSDVSFNKNLKFPGNYSFAAFGDFHDVFRSKISPDPQDDDPFINRITGWFTEDTTYMEPRANLINESTAESVVNNRPLRWKFAIQIFNKEFNLSQKLFGGGFSFLNWYGYYFIKDKTASEYPHNPFLHIMLYSGIIGLVLYMIMLFRVFDYYIRDLKSFSLFFVSFLITYFFTFFSGGSPFDPPVMGFFILLPFLLQSVQKKLTLSDKSQVNE